MDTKQIKRDYGIDRNDTVKLITQLPAHHPFVANKDTVFKVSDFYKNNYNRIEAYIEYVSGHLRHKNDGIINKPGRAFWVDISLLKKQEELTFKIWW